MDRIVLSSKSGDMSCYVARVFKEGELTPLKSIIQLDPCLRHMCGCVSGAGGIVRFAKAGAND
uniref:Uncharacterized protein n=1 Tax=Amphimedon queenslandica TaxID=400682 RepID=A0A1X7TQY8_AMPQE